jgi:hypothetical protein
MRGGSQRAFCQCRRLASKDNQVLLMPTMEDSSLRRIYDCQLSKSSTSDFGSRTLCVIPPLWRLANVLLKVRNRAVTSRDVKNGGTSGDVHENKARTTKCHAKNAAFYMKMGPLRENRQQSVGLFGRTRNHCATIRGEGGPKISSSAHRSIGGAQSWF